jgi:hypothetical protein
MQNIPKGSSLTEGLNTVSTCVIVSDVWFGLYNFLLLPYREVNFYQYKEGCSIISSQEREDIHSGFWQINGEFSIGLLMSPSTLQRILSKLAVCFSVLRERDGYNFEDIPMVEVFYDMTTKPI